jgi:ribose 5-phosphate isomerase A
MSSTSAPIRRAIHKSARHALSTYVKGTRLVGLGSGSAIAILVKELSRIDYKKEINFVTSSLQIKLDAEKAGLRIVDASRIFTIDLVFDGADQIDCEFNMIKGGGGALMKEKILISAANRVIILADHTKFVKKLTRPIPIEVHRFARPLLLNRIKELGGKPKLRINEKGYPYITENGNLILDISFNYPGNVLTRNAQLKSIPGVLEVGLFSRADIYYKAKKDGSFEIIKPTG